MRSAARIQTAGVTHVCAGCPNPITPGQKYVRFVETPKKEMDTGPLHRHAAQEGARVEKYHVGCVPP